MISERDIRDRIFKEFIAPTKVKKDYIGIEIEMPIINLNKKAVDFNVVHKVTNSFYGKRKRPVHHQRTF